MLGPLENGGHLRAEEIKAFFGVILGKVIHRKYEIAPSPKLTRSSWRLWGCLAMAHLILIFSVL